MVIVKKYLAVLIVIIFITLGTMISGNEACTDHTLCTTSAECSKTAEGSITAEGSTTAEGSMQCCSIGKCNSGKGYCAHSC